MEPRPSGSESANRGGAHKIKLKRGEKKMMKKMKERRTKRQFWDPYTCFGVPIPVMRPLYLFGDPIPFCSHYTCVGALSALFGVLVTILAPLTPILAPPVPLLVP